MSFDPKTGGPCAIADIRRGALKQIAEVRMAHQQPSYTGDCAQQGDVKLLPCPFCGGDAGFFENEIDFVPWPYVQCHDCDAMIDASEGDDKAAMAQRWNARAQLPAASGYDWRDDAVAKALNLGRYVGEATDQSILRAEAKMFVEEYEGEAQPHPAASATQEEVSTICTAREIEDERLARKRLARQSQPETPAATATAPMEFPYQQTFDAICAAVKAEKEPPFAIHVSVKAFQEAFNNHRDAVRQSQPESAPQLEPWRTELDEAIGHLGACCTQFVDTDDRIIREHVQAAHEILKIVRRQA